VRRVSDTIRIEVVLFVVFRSKRSMKNQKFSPNEELAENLTWREQDILVLLAERLSNREIANQLHIAETTVKDYVGKILSKLYAKNRREAVERAKTLGLLEGDRKIGAISPTNLPAESTPFIGRSDELTAIKRHLRRTRFLTITGPGGIGKTRLALKAAEEAVGDFPDGCFFVSLAPIHSVEDIIQTIAEAVRFPMTTHEDPQQQLLRYLQKRQLLLVLDNFEHLLAGASIVSQILQVAPTVKILATSRGRLNLQSETVLNLGGMALPNQGPVEDILDYDAVTLFVQRASQVRPGFDPSHDELQQVTRICEMVQGMPLAIELAAAWLHVINIEEIAKELEKGLDILATELRDSPARHRSIRAVFDHSWNLMDKTEQDIFMRLSVFRGGFTRDAAQHVAGASLQLLSGFVNKSVLLSVPNSARFEIHELLRQYAQERLEENPRANLVAYKAHASFFAEFMKARWEHVRGNRQIHALSELEADLENIRAGWHYYVDKADAKQLAKYIDTFWLFYWIRGWNHAGIELFKKTVEALNPLQGNTEADTIRATAMANHGFFLTWVGFADQGYALAKESIEILERLNCSEGLVFAYNNLVLATYYLGRFDEEKGATDKLLKLVQTFDDKWPKAFALSISGMTSFRGKDYEQAERSLKTSLHVSGEIEDATVSALSLVTLGNLATARGELTQAKEYYQHCSSISRKIGFHWAVGNSTKYLGQVALLEGKLDEAEAYFLQSLRIAYDLGMDRDIANHLYELAKLRVAQNRSAEAVVFLVLLLQQPASQQAYFRRGRIRDYAQELLTKIKEHVSPETYAAALERGKELDLDETVHKLVSPVSFSLLTY
jgi:predicted ATPase/DNA-binding CsgD family transcriptional regulator